jgi:hypothetical protein
LNTHGAKALSVCLLPRGDIEDNHPFPIIVENDTIVANAQSISGTPLQFPDIARASCSVASDRGCDALPMRFGDLVERLRRRWLETNSLHVALQPHVDHPGVDMGSRRLPPRKPAAICLSPAKAMS